MNVKYCNILIFDQAVDQETGASNQRYQNITLTCGWVEFGADATATGSRWASNNYITGCYSWSVSWSLKQTEFSLSCCHSSSSRRSWGQDAVVRASARLRAWALRTLVEQPSRMRKKCCYNTEELGINMLQSVSVFNSPLAHNQHQPFRNPFENKV